MSEPIRIGIAGYGNLGRGVEASIALNPDMALAGIFTRRPPDQLVPLHAGTPVHAMDALAQFEGAIDVLILCGGSKDDLPRQGPELAARFNTAAKVAVAGNADADGFSRAHAGVLSSWGVGRKGRGVTGKIDILPAVNGGDSYGATHEKPLA